MKDFTDIIVLVDRSGSMSMIKNDMEGGLNAFFKEQKETPGDANANLYQFDTLYEVVYENVPVKDVPDYHLDPRGGTALLDAMGRTIQTRGQYYASLPESERPERVVFLVITDGEENSSHEYHLAQINQMVTEQQEVYKWAFVFLGANMDAVSVGASMGFHAHTSMTYDADAASVGSTYLSVAREVSRYKSKRAPDMAFTNQDRMAASATFVPPDPAATKVPKAKKSKKIPTS